MKNNHADFNGSKNPNWKGDNVGYIGIHSWLRKNFNKPIRCELCNKIPKNAKDNRTKLEWANKSGKYLRDRTDWICLCTKCHCNYDKWWLKRTRDSKGRFM